MFSDALGGHSGDPRAVLDDILTYEHGYISCRKCCRTHVKVMFLVYFCMHVISHYICLQGPESFNESSRRKPWLTVYRRRPVQHLELANDEHEIFL